MANASSNMAHCFFPSLTLSLPVISCSFYNVSDKKNKSYAVNYRSYKNSASRKYDHNHLNPKEHSLRPTSSQTSSPLAYFLCLFLSDVVCSGWGCSCGTLHIQMLAERSHLVAVRDTWQTLGGPVSMATLDGGWGGAEVRFETGLPAAFRSHRKWHAEWSEWAGGGLKDSSWWWKAEEIRGHPEEKGGKLKDRWVP